MRRIPAMFSIWLSACLVLAAGDAQFRGRVVDREGQPVAEVVLSPLWSFPEQASVRDPVRPAEGQPSVTTDADGRFVVAGDVMGQDDWLALDAERSRGVLIHAGADGDTFTLEPLLEIKGSYDIEAAGSMPSSLGTWAKRRLGRNFVARCTAWSENFSLRLPPAAYGLAYSNGDLDHRSRISLSQELLIEAGDDSPRELGPLRLHLPRIQAVSGRVVGADGEPAPGVSLSRFWIASDGMVASVAHVTDETGRFKANEPVYQGTFPLIALDAERTNGALAVVDAESSAPLAVRLAPLVELRGRIKAEGSKKLPAGTNVTVSTARVHGTVARSSRDDGNFSFKLPPGEYQLFCYGTELETEIRGVTLEAGATRVDLGTITLPRTALARRKGERAPALEVTASRGLGDVADFDLAQLRGKWVAIEFWGHWCGPCVRESLPRLAQIYRKYEDRRDRFEVLAVHDPTVSTLDELDGLMKETVEGLWDGKPLPFPLLLDSTGKTVERYGIAKYPTLVLIDPQGRLVSETTEAELMEILEGL